LKYSRKGIRFDFQIEITGNLDETEDEAEGSAFHNLLTLKSEKGLHRNRGSLFRFGNRTVSLSVHEGCYMYFGNICII